MTDQSGGDRQPRLNMMLSGQVYRSDATAPTTHRVTNLSISGACIAQPHRLKVGDRIEIAIGQAETVHADVVRIDERVAALRFEWPIDLDAARKRRSADFVPDIATGWLAERQRVFR